MLSFLMNGTEGNGRAASTRLGIHGWRPSEFSTLLAARFSHHYNPTSHSFVPGIWQIKMRLCDSVQGTFEFSHLYKMVLI